VNPRASSLPDDGNGESAVTDRVGFEPTKRGCRLHAFQACAFNHSATCPQSGWNNAVSPMRVKVGKPEIAFPLGVCLIETPKALSPSGAPVSWSRRLRIVIGAWGAHLPGIRWRLLTEILALEGPCPAGCVL
jgi:hypothetical protein